MSKAGRAELVKTLSKALLIYTLTLIIIYSIINSSLTRISTIYINSLGKLIIAMFITLLTVLILRTIKSSNLTDYLIIPSVVTLGISLLIYEHLAISQRGLKVYVLPLINVLIHDGHAVLSVDLGQLFLLIALILILLKTRILRGKSKV